MGKQIVPPPPMPVRDEVSDIQAFARAYFNIELTSFQLDYIRSLASGKIIRTGKRAGVTTARNVINRYLIEGLEPHGRRRLPIFQLPVKEKVKGATQEGKVLNLIKRPGGAFNFELSRIALKYTSVISSLRQDGHNIVAERQYLKNGKPSNTWKYYLIGD